MNPVERLKSRIASEIQNPASVAITHRYVDTPIGRLLAIANPFGIVRIAFDNENQQDILAVYESSNTGKIVDDSKYLDVFAKQLEEYFNHERGCFSVPVDLHLPLGFRGEAIERLREITYGRTLSYGDYADRLGHPHASRAVGSACASNPVPLILPCHRVVRSDGTVGEYIGGSETKKFLLDFEYEACK